MFRVDSSRPVTVCFAVLVCWDSLEIERPSSVHDTQAV